MQSSQELISKVNEILKEEGVDISKKELSNSELLSEFILPGLKNSKDVLGSIYSFQTRSREGTLGKIKNAVQRKIINTVINVVEKQSMKQQKFNELTFRAIEALVQENKELRGKLKS